MSESEEEKSGNPNAEEAAHSNQVPFKDEHGRFMPGNSQRIGHHPDRDPVEMGRKGGSNPSKAKRLTTYLRQLLEKPVSEFPALKKYHELHGKKKAANFLMQRVFEEAAENPAKAHPLVRDILNRIDGMLVPEMEVDPDTPVTVIKFVVVDKRAQVKEENGDAAQV